MQIAFWFVNMHTSRTCLFAAFVESTKCQTCMEHICLLAAVNGEPEFVHEITAIAAGLAQNLPVMLQLTMRRCVNC